MDGTNQGEKQMNEQQNEVNVQTPVEANQPRDIDKDPVAQFIIRKFKRLDRERKDWKKCAKSLFVCLSKQKGKPKQKKLLEKYLKLKNKYRKNW